MKAGWDLTQFLQDPALAILALRFYILGTLELSAVFSMSVATFNRS